ncbi:ABC-F family ATP-binding cassette domain-containing protein [Eubacteriales bacterium OttesenSCG-928-M02]|nr:ABC-F family ATP-binding cassette domain-containing protein [Eubacteriales bacterium OttesenSCG-928-M02]
MNLITATDLSIAFAGNTLFSGVGFAIPEGERIGLVGINGSGKTTLMRMITGQVTPDTGSISMAKIAHMGYMEQHNVNNKENTIYNEVLTVFAPLMAMEKELEDINRNIEAGDTSFIGRQGQLHEAYQENGGLTYQSHARAALLGFGFREEEFSLPVGLLSGGQQAKIQLIKLLLAKPNVLLLDEPTNHLDITATTWLENYLVDYDGALVVISHDRYFLDKVTETTWEMENKRLTVYPGSYSQYMQQKETDGEIAARHYRNQLREVKRIEGIIEQQRRWNQARNYVTIASKQKQIDRLTAQMVPPEKKPQPLQFHFRSAPMSGQDVLTCRGLRKGYPGKPLFQELDLHITKGETVFLLGPNSAGKTTLLNIILGKIPPDDGYFTLGANVKLAYYDQTQQNLTPTRTILEELRYACPGRTDTELRTALGVFLFRGEDVFKEISLLSGGERARVALVKMMLADANFLLLDEPTNHLDITSREALEEALLQYDGTLLIVSHDRYFVNRLADRVIAFTPDGVTSYLGGYDDYVLANAARPAPEKRQRGSAGQAYHDRREQRREYSRRKGVLSRLEEEIQTLEGEISSLSAQLELPDIMADYARILEISTSIQEKEATLGTLYQNWETAEADLQAHPLYEEEGGG